MKAEPGLLRPDEDVARFDRRRWRELNVHTQRIPLNDLNIFVGDRGVRDGNGMLVFRQRPLQELPIALLANRQFPLESWHLDRPPDDVASYLFGPCLDLMLRTGVGRLGTVAGVKSVI